MRELTSACSAMDDSSYAFVLFPIRWRVIMIFDFSQSPLFIIPISFPSGGNRGQHLVVVDIKRSNNRSLIEAIISAWSMCTKYMKCFVGII